MIERRFSFGMYLREGEIGKAREMSAGLDGGALHPTIAIEILREFTSEEFSGRVYLPQGGQWVMARPQTLKDYAWSMDLREGKAGYIILKGSLFLWRIVQLRGEQDPDRDREYTAITLRRYARELDRWEGNVHYKDFTRDSIKTWPDRDASTVAEAWIYSEDKRHSLGIVVLVDELQVTTGAVTFERAIGEGAVLRNTLVQKYREQARDLRANRVVLYWWDGQEVG